MYSRRKDSAVVSDSCDPMACSLPGSSLSVGFSSQEYWSGLPFPSPGESLNCTLFKMVHFMLRNFTLFKKSVHHEHKKLREQRNMVAKIKYEFDSRKRCTEVEVESLPQESGTSLRISQGWSCVETAPSLIWFRPWVFPPSVWRTATARVSRLPSG